MQEKYADPIPGRQRRSSMLTNNLPSLIAINNASKKITTTAVHVHWNQLHNKYTQTEEWATEYAGLGVEIVGRGKNTPWRICARIIHHFRGGLAGIAGIGRVF